MLHRQELMLVAPGSSQERDPRERESNDRPSYSLFFSGSEKAYIYLQGQVSQTHQDNLPFD